MIAWIIRFEWFGDHAAVDNPIVDIVSGRKGEAYVCDHIQRLHTLLLRSFRERADFARGGQSASKPYLAKMERTRNGSVIVVGHNPCLTARKVKNFAVDIDKKTDKEIIVAEGLESSHVMDLCDMIGVGTGN